MALSLLNYLLISLASMFVIINPLSTAFVFASLVSNETEKEQRIIAQRATIISTIVIFVFAIMGKLIFKFFGISIPAFKIAGGIILFGIAYNMIWKQEPRFSHDRKSYKNTTIAEDLAIVPIAIPFISGPGAIATVMILVSEAPGDLYIIPVLIAVLMVTVSSYLAMVYSEEITKYMGNIGRRVMTKLFGIILAVISVQFVINGILDLVPKIVGLG